MNMISEGQDDSLFQSFQWPFNWQKTHWFEPKAAAADLRFLTAAAAATEASKFICGVYAMAGWNTVTEGYDGAEAETVRAIFNAKVNASICFVSLFTDISFTFYFIIEALQNLSKRGIESLLLWVAETSLFKSEIFSADFSRALRTCFFFINVNTKP